MYFSKTIAIVALSMAVTTLAAPTTGTFDLASPVADRDAAPASFSDYEVEGVEDFEGVEGVQSREAKPLELSARGFGCGTLHHDRYECNRHCKSLKGGRTGGYCGGFMWHTCICIFG